MALIELHGQHGEEPTEANTSILSMHSFKITPQIKRLEGMQFFDWVASHIAETVSEVEDVGSTENQPLPMGLAWSFPIECVEAV